MPEPRTLFVDPGDETGWCIGRGLRLLAGGQTKLWVFADEVWDALAHPETPELSILNGGRYIRDGVLPEENIGPFERIVTEDFRIYPWKAEELAWNPVRTARLIGALTWMAHHFSVEFVLQPASIKEQAQAAGAEELYWHPLKENRHQNDACQHFVHWNAMQRKQGEQRIVAKR